MMLRTILAMTICLIGYTSAAQINQPADSSWIQTVLKNWQATCADQLRISAEPLPWIIFYDSTRAWHINPDASLLPTSVKTRDSIRFGRRSYPLVSMPHAGLVWVPGRDPVAVASRPTATMPYDQNRKSFFVAPLPSYFHPLAPPDQAGFLNLLFLGLNGHELTHTRQLAFVLPQLLEIQGKYKLPESLDDNVIERIFGKNQAYKKLFVAEKQHFWNAFLAVGEDSCRQEITKGLALMKQRKKRFFAGEHQGYAYLDDIFLSLEGSAMWVQYQVTLANAPGHQPSQQTLFWLVERTASWVQEEGLVLFLLMNRLVPDWRSQFFEQPLPSPFDVLQLAVSKLPKK